jgi:hypothetical protein
MARARKLEKAQSAVEKAEAEVKRAQVNYCFSAARLARCVSTSVDTALDAMRTDSARDLNRDLQAKMAVRAAWTLKLLVIRDELAREVMAMWEMTGLMERMRLMKGEECDCQGKGVDGRGLE